MTPTLQGRPSLRHPAHSTAPGGAGTGPGGEGRPRLRDVLLGDHAYATRKAVAASASSVPPAAGPLGVRYASRTSAMGRRGARRAAVLG